MIFSCESPFITCLRGVDWFLLFPQLRESNKPHVLSSWSAYKHTSFEYCGSSEEGSHLAIKFFTYAHGKCWLASLDLNCNMERKCHFCLNRDWIQEKHCSLRGTKWITTLWCIQPDVFKTENHLTKQATWMFFKEKKNRKEKTNVYQIFLFLFLQHIILEHMGVLCVWFVNYDFFSSVY